MFAYALLANPHRWYWILVALYLEVLILATTVAAEVRTHPLATDPNVFLAQVGAELVLLALVLVHHEALRQHGQWLDFQRMEHTEECVTANSNADASLPRCARLVALLRRWFAVETGAGSDLYFFSFLTQFAGFVSLMILYFSITGSSTDLVASIQRSLLPGPLVLMGLALFVLMCLDRYAYLQKSALLKAALHFIQLGVQLYCWLIYLERPTEVRFGVRSLFAIYCAVLVLSGRQIKYGYPPFTRHRLTDKYSDGRYYAYLTFRSIPFIFELRNLLDWSITPTALKFWYWVKLEDIHHELVATRADKEDNKYWNRRLGQPFPRRSKVLVGVCGFTLLSIIIFAPLVLYASFSPALDRNPIDYVSVSLAFEGSPPLYTSRTTNPLPLLPVTQANELAALLQYTHPSLPPKLSNTDNFLQVISLTKDSQTDFLISPPTRRDLQMLLSDPQAAVRLELSATIVRHKGTGTGASAATVFTITQQWPVDSPIVRMQLSALLQPNPPGAPVPLRDFYMPYVFNSAAAVALMLPASGTTTPNAALTSPTASSPPQEAPTATPVPYMDPTGGIARQDCTLEAFPDSDSSYIRLTCKALFVAGNGINGTNLTTTEHQCLKVGLVGGSPCPNYDQAAANSNHSDVPLYFVAVSEKVTSSVGIGSLFEHFGIITLYTTFIGVLARILRWLVTNKTVRVPIEDMGDPTRLLTLVDDIKLARAEGDLTLEEELYEELINIFRSHELIKFYSAP